MTSSERFQFFVVVRSPSLEFNLQRVSLTNDLQASLTETFLSQAEEFIGPTVQKHPFHATYKPNRDEVVSINPFPLPPLLDRASKNPQEFSPIQMPFQTTGPIVKAILAVDDGYRSAARRFLFQHFDNSHILKQSWTFLFRSDTFHKLTEPGVTISGHLTAVIVGQELAFRSYFRTNQFLDLTPYFKEATDTEIKSFLGHCTFYPNDADRILSMCRPAMRKKFSAILYSKVLEHPRATPDCIQRGAKKFGINLIVKMDGKDRKLVFPDTPDEATKLLQYLAEELYISDLTEQHFETNSHRPLQLPTSPLASNGSETVANQKEKGRKKRSRERKAGRDS